MGRSLCASEAPVVLSMFWLRSAKPRGLGQSPNASERRSTPYRSAIWQYRRGDVADLAPAPRSGLRRPAGAREVVHVRPLGLAPQATSRRRSAAGSTTSHRCVAHIACDRAPRQSAKNLALGARKLPSRPSMPLAVELNRRQRLQWPLRRRCRFTLRVQRG